MTQTRAAEDTDRRVALEGRRDDTGQVAAEPWTVLAGREGNESCVAVT